MIGLSTYKPVKAEEFPERVVTMMAKKDAQFESAYRALSVNMEFSKYNAKLKMNVSKNRYKDIVPCEIRKYCKVYMIIKSLDDHSRVVLSPQDQCTGSDYINASFIDVSTSDMLLYSYLMWYLHYL